MENTITELVTFRGMPHQLAPVTNGVLTLVSETPVQIGDGFVFNSHRAGYDKKEATVFRVVEVNEDREANGTYKKPARFYNLQVSPVTEDIREQKVHISSF